MGHQSKIPISTDYKSIWTVLLYFCAIHIVIRSILCLMMYPSECSGEESVFLSLFTKEPPSLSQKIDARKLRCRRKCHLGHSRSPAFNMKTTFCRYGKFVASYHPFTRANILTKARGTMQECYHLYFSFCRRFKTKTGQRRKLSPKDTLQAYTSRQISIFFRILWCRK